MGNLSYYLYIYKAFYPQFPESHIVILKYWDTKIYEETIKHNGIKLYVIWVHFNQVDFLIFLCALLIHCNHNFVICKHSFLSVFLIHKTHCSCLFLQNKVFLALTWCNDANMLVATWPTTHAKTALDAQGFILSRQAYSELVYARFLNFL